MRAVRGETDRMTIQEAADIRALPDISTPRTVPGKGLVTRLRASETAHRLVPAPVALAGLDLAHRLAAARRPERLVASRAAMAAVVGGTPQEADLDELALRHLCAAARGWELSWRPWLLERLPVEGLDRYREIEPGRGVVFSSPHYGPPLGLLTLSRAVGTIDTAVGEHMAAADVPAGYNGHQIEQLRRVMLRSGYRPVRAASSAREFTRTLRGGGRVLLSFDVPGTVPVQFLGKTVELKNGAARLAEHTDSVIVPTLALPRGRGWYVHLDDPIDPRRFPSWRELLQAVADVQTRLVQRAPEHLESPLRAGGWATATATRWSARAAR